MTVRVRRGSSSGEFPPDVDLGSSRAAERIYLTREEFASKYGARARRHSAIRTFAAKNSLQVVQLEAPRRTVGRTFGAFNKALGTPAHLYSFLVKVAATFSRHSVRLTTLCTD